MSSERATTPVAGIRPSPDAPGPAAHAPFERTTAPVVVIERNEMPIIFLAGTLIAALLVRRNVAYLISAALWCVTVAMVGWGPATNDSIDTRSIVFWGPW